MKKKVKRYQKRIERIRRSLERVHRKLYALNREVYADVDGLSNEDLTTLDGKALDKMATNLLLAEIHAEDIGKYLYEAET